MASFERLIFEHDMIANAADAVQDALSCGFGAIAKVLSARTILCARLEDHLEREDSEMYPHLMRCGDGKTELIAQQFATDYLSLREEWARYLSRWTVATAGAQWGAFCDETRVILARLRQRVDDENALLYPAALGASVITLRDRLAA